MVLEWLRPDLEGLFRESLKEEGRIYRVAELQSRSGNVSINPQTLNFLLNRNVKNFQAGAGTLIGSALAFSMQDIVRQLTPQLAGNTQLLFEKLGLSAKEQASRKVGLARRHAVVLEGAREQVLQSYDALVARNGHLRYRRNEGRLSGTMEKALRDQRVWRATRDGVIIDGNVLDRAAGHWKRLNFGAGRAARRVRPVQMRLEGRFLGNLTFGVGPQPGFTMPVGVFFNARNTPVAASQNRTGKDKFYPMGMAMARIDNSRASDAVKVAGRRASRLNAVASGGRVAPFFETRGIRGYHFMEPGLQYLANNLPPMYRDLAREWMVAAMNEASRFRGPFFKAGLV